MSLQRFEGASIEAVLEEARAAAGPGVRIVEANRLRKGGIGGFFSKERFEVAVEVDGALRAPAVATAPPVGVDAVLALADQVSDGELASSLSTEQESFAALLGRISDDARTDSPGPVPEATRAPAIVDGPSHPLPQRALPEPARTPVPVVPASPAVGHLGLARLGLPASIVPAGDDPATGLLAALRLLPTAAPVPRAAGEVLVVVGERGAALDLARSLAADLGLTDEDVTLAAEGDDGVGLPLGALLPSLPAVAEERCAARWRRRPSIVAVATPVRPGASTFARRALEALEPTATWGAVSAAAKPEDVIAWSDSFGGIDAVAVAGLDDTATPASILGTGIPVARLDGRPASPALWTALLMERLAA